MTKLLTSAGPTAMRLTGGLLAAVVLLAGTGVDHARADSQTFVTPGAHSFTVPPGVSSILVRAIGARGGNCTSSIGGFGAVTGAILPVDPGRPCSSGSAASARGLPRDSSRTRARRRAPVAVVRAGPVEAGTAVRGAGGNGAGAGGGGASIVGLGGQAPVDQSQALVVAGGGGGATYDADGLDADDPEDTRSWAPQSGTAGTLTAGGAGGVAPSGGQRDGQAGTALTGGSGGGSTVFGDSGGGGGGGGYFGGGGGAAGRWAARERSGWGGGGSSFADETATLVVPPKPTTVLGARVTIYAPAPGLPTATVAVPAAGGSYVLGGEERTTSFSCAEGSGGPGLATCVDDVGFSSGDRTLNTSTIGAHTYSVTATSQDGLSRTTAVSYSVWARPAASIASPSSGGVYDLGQAVPTIFTCADAAGSPGLASCTDSSGDHDDGRRQRTARHGGAGVPHVHGHRDLRGRPCRDRVDHLHRARSVAQTQTSVPPASGDGTPPVIVRRSARCR
jgi:hypothetical protein